MLFCDPALKSAEPAAICHALNADTVVRPNAFKALVDFMDTASQAGNRGQRLNIRMERRIAQRSDFPLP